MHDKVRSDEMELTRRNRPIVFDQYIGNQEVKQLIRNSVANESVFPKVILSGMPGIGKSTLGLVMALAMQCPHSMDGNPCLQCEVCEEIIDKLIMNNENCCNVNLINMADKKGIADAREIMDLLSYRKSTKYKYTIFILEEPQNMSIDAQDLLNKPLEFLPAHVKIIFTTTDLHKMSEAIQSRSNVYKLKAPSLRETTDLLAGITEKSLAKKIPKGLLELIVEYSDNVPRNAINNLELVLQTKELSVESINNVLGLVNFGLYVEFFEIVHKDIMAVAKFVGALKDKGCSYTEFAGSLHIFMTDLFKMTHGIPCNRYTKSQVKRCRDVAKGYSYNEFLRLQVLSTELARSTKKGERYAESLLYEFALKVNQKFDIHKYFKEEMNSGTEAIKAYKDRKLEEFKDQPRAEITEVMDIISTLEKETGVKATAVQGIDKLKVNTDTNIIY